MRIHGKFLAFLLLAVCVLGLPAFLIWTPDPAQTPADPMERLLAQQSTLGERFAQWQEAYVAQGGDRDVQIRLGWALGLSKVDFTPAGGEARLNLYEGTVEAKVNGLDEAVDLWLVDNAPDESAAISPNDRMVRLGSVGVGETLSADLGDRFFDDFMVDLVVATRTDQTPAEGAVLFGARSLFESLHTQARMEARNAEPSLLRSIISGLTGTRPAEASHLNILVAKNLVSQQVADGGELFLRGTFQGNGRTCGTCHPVENNQTIDVDFISSLPANDALFVAEFPVSQGGVPGLERPLLMRGHGLILENVDGAENPTVKFTMRSVPHSLSMDTSVAAPADGRAPVERTGWSGDGAPMTGALKFFSMGAVFQHATKSLARVEGTDFVFPTENELLAMEAFMRAVGRTNELDLSVASFNDPGAENGRLVFLNQGKCNGCHGNAGAISAFGGNRNFNTGVEDLFNPAQNTEAFPLDGGFGVAPRDCDGDLINDCFGDGTFNTTPLVEAADTPPFFHNNVVQTVEGSVAFYNGPEFNNSPAGGLVGGISITPQEVDDVAAFLRVINAAFNIDITQQRVAAARSLENNSPFKSFAATTESTDVNGSRATVDALLALANIEAADAVEVLNDRGLHPSTVSDLMTVINNNNAAIAAFSSRDRARLMEQSLFLLAAMQDDLGTNDDFVMGEGNLVF